MNIIDIKELSELKGFNTEQINRILMNSHTKNSIEKLMFKEFWEYYDCPIPIMFIKNGKYYITRNKQVIGVIEKMVNEQKMSFADISTLPKSYRGKKSRDWLLILAKIPEGKMWVPEKDEVNVSTLRKAIVELEENKKIATGQYTVTQRSEGKDNVKSYVLHNKLKKA